MNDSTKDMKRHLERLKQQAENDNKAAVDKAITARDAKIAMDRQLEQARLMDELSEGGHILDEKGNKIPLWDVAIKKAQNAIDAEVMAYNDWRAAMMGLLTLYAALVDALHQSVDESIWAPLQIIAKNYALYPLADAIRNKFTGDPKVDLPTLIHNVHLNENNELVIDPLVRSDGNEKSDPLQALFEKGISIWLKDMGYKPDSSNPKKFVNAEGETLSLNIFKKLKNDPDKGLSAVLNINKDLKFEAVADQQPSIRASGP